MNRFIKFLLGTKPKPGTYYCDAHAHVINEEDISKSLVRIRYSHLDPHYCTFREFHIAYTQYNAASVFNKEKELPHD